MTLWRERALAERAVDKLRVFAQPQRLMILSYLLDGERTVGDIDAATGIGQPALSQQLAELRRSELVRTRRAAKQVYYSLADAEATLCVRTLEAIMTGSGQTESRLADLLKPQSSARTAHVVPAGAIAFARLD